MGRALGVDLGTRRIGLALSDPARTIASPHAVVERSGDPDADAAAIVRAARDSGADVVVVGLPLRLDGRMGPAARAALDDVARIRAVAGATPTVEVADERLTTVTAERGLVAAGVRRQARRRVVDKVAAAVMLQSWLDGQRPR